VEQLEINISALEKRVKSTWTWRLTLLTDLNERGTTIDINGDEVLLSLMAGLDIFNMVRLLLKLSGGFNSPGA